MSDHHPRWPRTSEVGEVATVGAIHARLTNADEYALCEADGPTLPSDSVTLILNHPLADTAWRPVDCPGCLEWMHA